MASGRPGAGAPPPSFKTNVNRMKTKRWVEAKSYSYDGDDWGDADEYEEYDGYDDPPQASLPAPAVGAPHPPRAPFAQQQQPGRSGSPGRPPYAQDHRERSGSFGRGDETRSFSGPPGSGSPMINPIHTAYGSGPPGSPRSLPQQGHPQGRSSMEGQRPGAPLGNLPPPGARPFASAESGGRTWSMGSQGSQGGPSFAQRRDYSPSGAFGAPHQQQQQQQQQQHATRPPRKSSLSQEGMPSPQVIQNISTQPAPSHPNSQPERRSEDAAEPPSPAIIRPADIYKRFAQEKEKERLSQESSRPSTADLASAHESKLADEGLATSRQRKHTLDTVAERKSEYGLENLQQNSQPTTSVPKASTSPQLPDFGSGNGFGIDFSSSFDGQSDSARDERRQSIIAAQEAAKADTSLREADIAKQATELSHQPSQGFRSAVSQAFDEPVASTPAGSDIIRSDTTSTNAISPIISRNTSKGQQEANSKGLAVNMGSIAEEMAAGRASSEEPSPNLQQGHRRSLNPPSSEDSPARTARLEVKNDFSHGSQHGAFDANTPAEETRRKRSESAAKAMAIQNVVESLSAQAQQSPLSQASHTRADSPTKGRVRDLVDKAESAGSSRRGSQSSISQERAESIRPSIPGGWNSYTTNSVPQDEKVPVPVRPEDTSPSSLPGAAINPSLTGQGGTPPQTNMSIPDVSKDGLDPEPTTERRSVGQADAPLMPSHAPSVVSSIMPTPKGYSPNPSSENLPTDVPSIAPLRQQRIGGGPSSANIHSATGVSTSGAPVSLQGPGSLNSSLDESPLNEHDQLSRDIVRQLSPNPPVAMPENSEGHSVPPAEVSSQGESEVGAQHSKQPPVETYTQQPKQQLRHRFSWEEGGEEINAADTPPPPQQQPQAPTEAASNYRAPKSFGSILGGGSSGTSVPQSQPSQAPAEVPAPATQARNAYQGSLPTIGDESQSHHANQIQELSSDSSPLIKPTETSVNNVKTQVVTVVPEPELTEDTKQSFPPAPLAKESAPPTPISKDIPRTSSSDDEPSSPVLQKPLSVQQPQQPQQSQQSQQPQQYQQPRQMGQGARQAGQGPQPGQAPVHPFKEILAMKSPEDRLRVFRNTQDTFYHMDTGLNDWIRIMGQNHPEHNALLQSRGQFTTPTPGMPGPMRPQQGGTSQNAGSSFSGLRKPGVAAAPAMSEAGAALKSATRDTKKLAKGLFAKGRSKFAGRDKAPPQITTAHSNSPLPTPAPQQNTYMPYRPGIQSPQSPQPNQPTQFSKNSIEFQHSPGARHDQAPYVRQAYKPSPPLNPLTTGIPASPSQADLKTGSQAPGALRLGDAHIVASTSASRPTHTKGDTEDDDDEDYKDGNEKALPPPPPIPDSPPDAKPVLKQRLTVHHKDMEPFEVTFPDDLVIPEKFKQEAADKATPLPSNGASKSPLTASMASAAAKGNQSSGSTPKQGQFPTRSSSRAARTLDPGKSSHPSWLNFTPPIGTPTTLDFLAQMNSPSSSSPAMSPPLPKSPLNPQPLQLPGMTDEYEDGNLPNEKQFVTPESKKQQEERPFSFINFSEAADNNFSLNEVTFEPSKVLHSRPFSVATTSTGDETTAPSTSNHPELNSFEDARPGSASDGKPLPSLPPGHDVQSPPQQFPPYASQSMPVNQRQQSRPSLSLFPQTRPRGNTQGSMGGDFGPPAARPGTGGGIVGAPSTMPALKTREKRSMSGGASGLLQRAFTNMPGSNSPKREKSKHEIPKAEKKKRRLSGLGGIGNFLQQAKGQIKVATAPLRSQGAPNQLQHRPYTPNQGQGQVQAQNQAEYQSFNPKESYRPYTPQGAQDQPGKQYGANNMSPRPPNTFSEPQSQQRPRTARSGNMNGETYSAAGSPTVGRVDAPPKISTDERSANRLSAAGAPSPLHSKFSPYRPSTSDSKSIGYNQMAPHSPSFHPGNSPSLSSHQVRHKPGNLNLRPQASPNSMGMHSEAFPRAPDSAHSTHDSMSQSLSTPMAPSHEHARSNASVTSRRSHAPSLSINTNVPTPNATPRQPQQATLKPDVQQTSRSRSNSSSKESSQERSQERSQPVSFDRSEAESKSMTSRSEHEYHQHQQQQQKQPELESKQKKPNSRRKPRHDPEYYDDEDDAPSDLEALPGFDPQPVSATNTVSALTTATPGTATPATGTADGNMPPLPPIPADGIASRRSTGKNNRITLTPAALRIVRQREIELGGETRMNSPEAAPESANKRLGLGKENSGLGIELDDGEDAGDEREDGEKDKKEKKDEKDEEDERKEHEEKEKGEQKEDDKRNDSGSSKSSSKVTKKMTVPRRSDEEAVPKMTATSFPGQEWNPYG